MGAWLIFRRELRTVSHAPWVFLLRAAYPLALLAFLASEYASAGWPEEASIAESGEFAQRCAHTILVAQLRTVLLLTPLLVCGTFAAERRRGTLDLLLTTHLSRADIVLGKVVARMAIVASVLLGGVPVLAVLMLSGGVSVDHLTAGTIQTAVMIASLAGVSAACAVRIPTPAAAALTAWVVYGLPVVVCCGCLFAATPLDTVTGPGLKVSGVSPLNAVPYFVILHGGFGLASLIWAVERLGRVDPPRPLPPVVVEYGPLGDDPFWWREWEREPGGWTSLWPVILIIPTLAFGSALHATFRPISTATDVALAFAGSLAVLAVVAMVPAATSITRERAARRLDDFRTLPDGPEHLLRAKWWAAMRSILPVVTLAACCLLLATAQEAPLLGAIVALAMLLAGTATSAAVGLWHSARSSDSFRAVLAWCACVGTGILLPGMVVWPALFVGTRMLAAVPAGLLLVGFWAWAAIATRRAALRCIETGG